MRCPVRVFRLRALLNVKHAQFFTTMPPNAWTKTCSMKLKQFNWNVNAVSCHLFYGFTHLGTPLVSWTCTSRAPQPILGIKKCNVATQEINALKPDFPWIEYKPIKKLYVRKNLLVGSRWTTLATTTANRNGCGLCGTVSLMMPAIISSTSKPTACTIAQKQSHIFQN